MKNTLKIVSSIVLIIILLSFFTNSIYCQDQTIEELYFNTISQELPELMDLAQLKLEVTNTEVVGQISSYNTTLSAKEGFKLFVVTLIGIVTEPCQIIIGAEEFSAIYEEETTNNKGEKETSFRIKVSAAIAKGDSWSISQVGHSLTSFYYIKEPGPIIIKVAFILPEKITNFFVRYPALTKGKATVSAQAGE